MKKLYCLVVLSVSLSYCTNAGAWSFKPFSGWDKAEKALFAASCVLRTVDMLQTNDIYHNTDRYHEINPAIDGLVNQFGTKAIPVWFIGGGILEYLVLDALPHRYRKIGLGITNAVSLGLVYHNNKIGLGLNFSF